MLLNNFRNSGDLKHIGIVIWVWRQPVTFIFLTHFRCWNNSPPNPFSRLICTLSFWFRSQSASKPFTTSCRTIIFLPLSIPNPVIKRQFRIPGSDYQLTLTSSFRLQRSVSFLKLRLVPFFHLVARDIRVLKVDLLAVGLLSLLSSLFPWFHQFLSLSHHLGSLDGGSAGCCFCYLSHFSHWLDIKVVNSCFFGIPDDDNNPDDNGDKHDTSHNQSHPKPFRLFFRLHHCVVLGKLPNCELHTN